MAMIPQSFPTNRLELSLATLAKGVVGLACVPNLTPELLSVWASWLSTNVWRDEGKGRSRDEVQGQLGILPRKREVEVEPQKPKKRERERWRMRN